MTDHPTDTGCCTSCKGTGRCWDPETGCRCWDCRGTGHPHDGPCGPDHPTDTDIIAEAVEDALIDLDMVGVVENSQGDLAHVVAGEDHYLADVVDRITAGIAEALTAARTIETVETVDELAGYPDGTVLIGPDGLVGEKRDWPLDTAVRYVNGTQETNSDIPMPARILYRPDSEDPS